MQKWLPTASKEMPLEKRATIDKSKSVNILASHKGENKEDKQGEIADQNVITPSISEGDVQKEGEGSSASHQEDAIVDKIEVEN